VFLLWPAQPHPLSTDISRPGIAWGISGRVSSIRRIGGISGQQPTPQLKSRNREISGIFRPEFKQDERGSTA
jgi:hypothetical protein